MLNWLNILVTRDLLSKPEYWQSLIINKRKPVTYRIFTFVDDKRICLHKFLPCDNFEDSFSHPHPWPAAFKILKGGYMMHIGQSFNNVDEPEHMEELFLPAGSQYEIVHPHTWHRITPQEETYTVMVNAPEWAEHIKHKACRTTKGKDLDSLSENEIVEQLSVFSKLLFDR